MPAGMFTGFFSIKRLFLRWPVAEHNNGLRAIGKSGANQECLDPGVKFRN
jgi:hypothetical protein